MSKLLKTISKELDDFEKEQNMTLCALTMLLDVTIVGDQSFGQRVFDFVAVPK